jgi:peroxiredoxin
MKINLPIALITLALCAPLHLLRTADHAAAAPADAEAELTAVLGRIQAKAQAGQKSEQEFAGELKELDALLARHHGEQTNDVAQILLTKAQLYFELFGNTAKCVALINQLKADFPETAPGKQADSILKMIARMEDAKKIQASLVVGAAFPGFTEADVAGKPLSLDAYRGKVVLVDFWATWCGPCVAELPNVLETYRTYHARGFEIIGISLDKDLNALTTFIKDHDLSWQQYFDGRGWENKLAAKYGIRSIPTTFLVDGKGRIVAKDLRGNALAAELAKLLGNR